MGQSSILNYLASPIRKLVDGLDHVVNEYDPGYPHFQKGLYTVYPSAKENFHPIEENQNSRRIAFVDGGNQELIAAPNFSVQLNRIYFNIFEGTKRIHQDDLPQMGKKGIEIGLLSFDSKR